MVAVLTLLLAVTISLLVTRAATLILTVTGLPRQIARFQARSALSGTGFTTREAELVVRHPVRRRVVMALMLIGPAGLVTVMASLVLSFAGRADPAQRGARLGFLVGGLLVIWLVSRSAFADRFMTSLIRRALRRWTDLDVRGRATLLHVAGDWHVSEVAIEDGDWAAGRTIRELALADERLILLGVARPDGFVGAPDPGLRLHAGDILILYGRDECLSRFDHERGGPPTKDAGDGRRRDAQAS